MEFLFLYAFLLETAIFRATSARAIVAVGF